MKINLNLSKEEFKKKLGLRDGIDGKDGRDGIDGRDADEEKIVKEVLSKIPEQEEVILDSPEEIKEKLESLKEDDRLSREAVSGLEEALDELRNASVRNAKVIGGLQGVFLYIDDAKKGIAKNLNLKAGTNLSLSHSYANGRQDVTINADNQTTTPAGSTGEIQFNDAGSFGADSNLKFNTSTKNLVLGGNIELADTKYIQFGDTDTRLFEHSTDIGSGFLSFDGANGPSTTRGFTTSGAMEIYANTGVAGGGNWEPWIELGSDGILGLNASAGSNPRIVASSSGLVQFSTSGGNVNFITSTGSGGDIDFNSISDILFKISSSEKMRIDNSGNVGIGTASPSNALTVADSSGILVSDSVGVGGWTDVLSVYDGDTTGKIQWYLSQNKFFIDKEVSITANAYSPTLMPENATATNPVFVLRSDTDTGIGGTGSNNLDLITGGVNALHIDSSQNIGIGETTPLAKLHIKTSATTDVGQIIQGVASQTANLFEIQNSTGSNLFDVEADGDMNFAGRNFHFNYDDAGTTFIHAGSSGAGNDMYIGGAGTLGTSVYSVSYGGINLRRPNILGWTSGTDMNTITDTSFSRLSAGVIAVGTGTKEETDGTLIAGTIGIGTASPLAKLHVSTGASGATPLGGSDIAVFETSGDDGISLLSPDIRTTNITFGTPTDSRGSIIKWDYSNLEFTLGTDITNGVLLFRSGSSDEGMRLTPAGRLGINQVTPVAQLDIVNANPSVQGIIIKGAVSQSANLQEWQNSAGTVLSKINSVGELNLPQINDAVTPTLSFGDGDTGFYEVVDDHIRVSTGGNISGSFISSGVMGGSSGNSNPILMAETPSSTNPGFAFYGDEDTGIGRAGANILSLITGGAEAIRINGSQNVGIGTSSPTARLHLPAGTATANTAPIKFTSGTFLTTPEAGTIEYDGHFHVTNVGLQRVGLVTANNLITSTTTVANTTTETTIYSYTFGANQLKAPIKILFNMSGVFSNASAADDFTLRFKINGTTVRTVARSGGLQTNAGWKAIHEGTVRTDGATGTFVDVVSFQTNGESVYMSGDTTENTLDTTSSIAYTVTIQWDNAKAGNTFSCTEGDLTFKH